MSAMDQMLISIVKKSLPPELFEKITEVSQDVSTFINETRARLDRMEAALERIENGGSDNQDGRNTVVRIGSLGGSGGSD